MPQIAERAAKYVSNTATSYRRGVCSANLPIFYAQGSADKSAPRDRYVAILNSTTVAHTSLFHWVTALGSDALRQPKTVHADFAPASRKYMSERRRSILIACRTTCSVLLSDQAPTSLPCG